MNSVTTVYKKTMKMSDLIDADFSLLMLLDRLDISLGFSEKTVDAVCKERGFDSDCFIFLAHMQSKKALPNIEELFDALPLEPFLEYLKYSHNHFLDQRLPNIRRKLEKLFEGDANHDLHDIVLDFFDKYTKEVMDHMHYEDNVVFPYIDALMRSDNQKRYSIEVFEEVHTDIEGKMSDLKLILMKYVSSTPNRALMINILMELYVTGNDLEAHKFLEDSLVIPRVRKLEKGCK